MKMDDKILTIGIPTYNREKYLKRCLDLVLSQKTDRVAIVVQDNASTSYDFYSFIEQYKEYDVEFRRNSVNIGGDANIARLFENCSTEWLWVLGDDDMISEGAVQTVLDSIDDNNDAIFIKLNSKYERNTIGLSEFANVFKERWSFGRCFFISEGLHNIKITQNDIYYHYRYLSTSCAQVLRVMRHLAENPTRKCVFLNKPIISNQCCDIPSWSYVEYMYNQLVIFDIFNNQRKLLKNNIFKDIVTMCFTYIEESDLPLLEKIRFYNLFAYKHGVLNTIRYNYFDIFRSVVMLVLGNRLFKKIMNRVRR